MEQHAVDSTLRTSLAATADPQLLSPFFSVLPPEIRRMIYVECWRHNLLHSDAREQTGERTLKYHIEQRRSRLSARYTHSPCVVSDQTSHDLRIERLDSLGQENPESDTWLRRIESRWAVHWPCEEIYRNASHRQRSTFMSTLLACKLMLATCHPICCQTPNPLSGSMLIKFSAHKPTVWTHK